MVSDNKQCISNSWFYKKNKSDSPCVINIPHSNITTPYNYFDEKLYQFTSFYSKELFISDDCQRIILAFDGVMTAFKLFVNSIFVGEYKGGYIPHYIEITEFVKRKNKNNIYLEVDSSEREDIPPFGNIVDYLTFGGIYRDVWLYSLDKIYIKNVFFKYKVLNQSNNKASILCTPIIQLDNEYKNKEYEISISISDFTTKAKLYIQNGIKKYDFPSFELSNINLWSIDNPNMYECKINLENRDTATIKLGFRELTIQNDKILLNGEKISLVGLNRHQTYPYVGGAMPKRVQEQDAIILKKELGLNTVRTSHYPQSSYFLDKCDDLGLIVLEEIPGWQHISQREDWREQVLKDVQAMIERDFNHPSIITWGVRINESQDDHDLYIKTNELAHELDDTRLTSGVRCIERSEFLEDIYTMNDFIHDGSQNILRTQQRCTGLKTKVPYIVTEFCGHIYPTKKFDQEERLIEHALRHGRVQSLATQSDEILGAVGWCAFDYNTHYDFGSGDRICYHGVMDMFRIPKFAAAVYKSQRDIKFGYVLEPLTYWARGEKAKGQVFPIHVFTNCDVIEVFMGGVSKGKFSRQLHNTDLQMQYLKYPPFVIQMNVGEWGASWTDAEFIGYADMEQVISKKFVANPIYSDIDVIADDNELNSNLYDATRITVRAVDQVKNIIPYINESISIQTEGDIEIIGSSNITLIGGSIGFWVRTKVNAQKGKCKVKINSSIGYSKIIDINLI